MRDMKDDTTIDFYILNISELSEDDTLDDIIPPKTITLWEK